MATPNTAMAAATPIMGPETWGRLRVHALLQQIAHLSCRAHCMVMTYSRTVSQVFGQWCVMKSPVHISCSNSRRSRRVETDGSAICGGLRCTESWLSPFEQVVIATASY